MPAGGRQPVRPSLTALSAGIPRESRAARLRRLSASRSLGELGGMNWTWRIQVVIAALLAGALNWGLPGRSHAIQPEAVVAVEPLVALAKRAGLRVLQGDRLVLVTDRPVRAGDGVEELPAVFDQAFAAWCDHFDLPRGDVGDWRAVGCLVVDRERFRAAGLLPDAIPPFANGFCDRNRFWLLDQSNPAYRRHLLLHEGVHAFTLTLRGMAPPVWYGEGIAEYLATHRLDHATDGSPRVVSTPIPERPEDVEQLGRIEEIRHLRATGRCPSLADVLSQPVGEHAAIADYATSWAAVVLFTNHPAYAKPFTAVDRDPVGPDLNRQLAAMPGWDADRASRDFDAFTAGIDYGWDFSRMAIDWDTGPLCEGPQAVVVAADRGWQNSGISAAAGQRYAISARGRVGLGAVTDSATGVVTPIESEPDGITLEWYRGRPSGRLLVAQWGEAEPDSRPRFLILAEGAESEFLAVADGPLYLMLNESPGHLGDNTGSYTATIGPVSSR